MNFERREAGVARGHRPSGYPRDAWYVAADADEVGREPLARRVLGVPLVLYRTEDGQAVALEDRDAHRPYPLSLGHLEGDRIVSGYSGFTYDPDGACVFVPTQAHVPVGARVRAFPVVQSDGLMWVWSGEPGLASRRPPPRTPWLSDPGWTTLGEQWETAASTLLLHENFADITHVAVVDPFIAPPALHVEPPDLQVEVSETSVSFRRDYPPSPVTSWHAEILGVAPASTFEQREEGTFVSTGLWVDAWHVFVDDQPRTFRFTHAVTPVAPGRTRHIWRVSRNFAPGAEISAALAPTFATYYRRVQQILETMQRVIDVDGPRDDVTVNADAVVRQVRRIVTRMLAEEA